MNNETEVLRKGHNRLIVTGVDNDGKWRFYGFLPIQLYSVEFNTKEEAIDFYKKFEKRGE